MNFTRLFDLLAYQEARYPNPEALCIHGPSGIRKYSIAQIVARTDQLSVFFMEKGCSGGDVLAIYAEHGCPEWDVVEFAAMQVGMTTVAIHENYLDEELEYVIQEVEPKLCFISQDSYGQRLKKIGFQGEIFCFKSNTSFKSLDACYHTIDPTHRYNLNQVKDSIRPESLATIVYTSGATGLPKGVMLSHHNIISNIKSCISLIPIDYKSVVASFLPLSHIFERTVNYTCIAAGASIWYVEDRQFLMGSIQYISPHFISTVPKLLEKSYSYIRQELNQRKLIVRKIIHWAMSFGASYSTKTKWSPIYWIKKLLAEILLFRKWRKLLGGRLKYVGVGGAAMDPALAKLYSGAGIKVREGYGMTECSPVISFNRFEPGGVVFGTVGIPIPGIEVKIDQADETGVGEILVKGPNVMLGYFKRPELTKHVLKGGWLHTGDMGLFVQKRFLKISGRKKNMFKTTTGRYIVPERIENILNANPYIEHSYIIGDGKSFVSALIVPDFQYLKDWAKTHHVHWTAPRYIVLNPKVEDLFHTEIEQINQQLKSEEQIRKLQLIYDDWQAETGELTSILKIKRKVLQEKYRKEIARMYAT